MVKGTLVMLVMLALAAAGSAGCHGPGSSAEGSDASMGRGGSSQILQSSLAVANRSVGFAVFSPAPIPPTVLKDTQDAARSQFPGVHVLFMPMEAPLPQALIFAPEIASFAPPTEQQLTIFARGLDPAQQKAATQSKGVLVLGWKLDADPRHDHLRDGQRLAYDVAQKTSGFIWDENTSQLYGLPTWKKTRLDGWDETIPDIRQHISLHVTSYGTHHRTVTLGMVKFGLPDLVISDVLLTDGERMTKVLEAVAQLLVEGGSPGTSGELAIDLKDIRHSGAREALIGAAGKDATLRGRVALVTVPEMAGDPQNRLVELRFITPGAPSSSTDAGLTDAQQLSLALTQIMGAPHAP